MKQSDIAALIRNKKLRMTRLRVDIIALLESRSVPMTAKEIMAILQCTRSTHKTSIYRQLDVLVGSEILRSTEFGDAVHRYEFRSDHHHHLICLHCGCVQDIDGHHDLDDIEQSLFARYRFQVHRHNLEFFGTCSTCT